MDAYRDIIRTASATLEKRLRESVNTGAPVFAYALFTTEDHDGGIAIVTGWDARPQARIGEFEIIRTPYGDRWNAVPYPAIHSLLYEACRRSPILPRAREHSGKDSGRDSVGRDSGRDS